MIFKQKKTKINKMVNYENGMIYKLCCKNPEIKDIYIGSTTNFRLRKNSHKCRCHKETNSKHHLYVYRFIRENGGFINWDMVLLEKVNCKDRKELHKKEREWFDKINPTLNCDKPARTHKEWHEDNKERMKQWEKEWREKNKEKIKQKKKEYYEKNKEKIKEWREKNKEKLKQKSKEYREKNKEKGNCPHCNKEMYKINLTRHIKKYCKEIKK